MKFIYIIVLLSFSLSVKAQRKQIFHFIVANKVITDSSTGFYQGRSLEYNYTRFFYGDSCFEEVGLFGDGNNSSKMFKVKKGVWYIKHGKKWSLFYSPYKRVIPKIKISGSWYSLKAQEAQLLNRVSCLIYDVVPLSGTASGDIKYWFNPLWGIVQIKTNEIELIREDFKNSE